MDTILVSETMLNSLQEDNLKTLILSGWAKADSAYIHPYSESIEGVASYITERKFEINATIVYADGEEQSFVKQFDWMNTEWQYCSLPITLEDKTISSISCSVDYQNNTGSIQYTNLNL